MNNLLIKNNIEELNFDKKLQFNTDFELLEDGETYLLKIQDNNIYYDIGIYYDIDKMFQPNSPRVLLEEVLGFINVKEL